MKDKLHRSWRKIPTSIRRPIALFVGFTLVLLAGAIGWLPGPGGIPVFLLGIYVLASEFSWADNFKRLILSVIHSIGSWLRKNKLVGGLAITASLCVSLSVMYLLWRSR